MKSSFAILSLVTLSALAAPTAGLNEAPNAPSAPGIAPAPSAPSAPGMLVAPVAGREGRQGRETFEQRESIISAPVDSKLRFEVRGREGREAPAPDTPSGREGREAPTLKAPSGREGRKGREGREAPAPNAPSGREGREKRAPVDQRESTEVDRMLVMFKGLSQRESTNGMLTKLKTLSTGYRSDGTFGLRFEESDGSFSAFIIGSGLPPWNSAPMAPNADNRE